MMEQEKENKELDELLIKLFYKWRNHKKGISGFPKSDEAQVEAFLEIVSERLPALISDEISVCQDY